MAKELPSDKEVVAFLKKNPDAKVPAVAREFGVSAAAIVATVWRLEAVADPSLAVGTSPTAVANARDKEGLRWERIAARSGLSVADVKRKYTEKTGLQPEQSYTGRGRDFTGSGGTKSKAKATGAKRGRPKGTSGRRQAAAKAEAPKRGRGRPKGSGRGRGRPKGARTRAEAKAGSPS